MATVGIDGGSTSEIDRQRDSLLNAHRSSSSGPGGISASQTKSTTQWAI